jgi:uncharacterized lipoprotein YbaY
MTRLTGEIVLPPDLDELPPSAVVHVVVEDVSRADADSVVAAESDLRGVRTGAPVAFELNVPSVDAHAHYSVRVHVDMEDRGHVAAGDLISTESHPVLTRGHGQHVTVRPRRIG